MAEAYAALVSVMHIIEQIEHHPCPPISLEKKKVKSLTKNVTFLQEFLEVYSSHFGYTKEADGLESRIADAAHAAEDAIECHIVDRIHAGFTSQRRKTTSIYLYQDLKKVVEDMNFIKKEVMEMTKEKKGTQDPLHRDALISADSSRSASRGHNSVMVGFEDVFSEVMDKLIGGRSHREVIAIVGMGGIGKTTFATNIYHNQAVVQHFDICAWVTISREYNMIDILLQLLQEDGMRLSQMNEFEFGHELHKKLSGRRYLIILDDIWDIELWDQLKLFFLDNNNGSRIMLTSRLSDLGLRLSGSHCIQMNFLDEDNSWELFCQNVFGEENCPLELEDTGKEIASNCRGLPLSIVVIGGLLTKSSRTQEYWEYALENLNSIVNLEDNERCLQILYMSYNSLPVHLKPCFLYMGGFAEESEIRASELIKLWVAEGFLKLISGKSLEEVAEEYLKELINRNLILVHKWNLNGKIKSCKIHDLLRDLCLREAQKQKFLCVLGVQGLNKNANTERRICINQYKSKEEYSYLFLSALEPESLARSLIWELDQGPNRLPRCKLLRVSSMVNHSKGERYQGLEHIFQQFNLRYLHIRGGLDPSFKFPSSVSLLWNLQTLIVCCYTTRPVTAPFEIWKMPQLRHVKFLRPLVLPDPPKYGNIVLKNLQTLSDMYNFKCSDKVVKRIPHIKKLSICYGMIMENHRLDNLIHLHKLESLNCFCDPEDMLSHSLQNLSFPHSLKKLTLQGTRLHWEDMTTKIGSLPVLEVLRLKRQSFMGPEWETTEDQFCSLKFLLIEDCNELEY